MAHYREGREGRQHTPRQELGPRTQWMLRQQGRRPENYSHELLMAPTVMPSRTPASFFSEAGAIRRAEFEKADNDRQLKALEQARRSQYGQVVHVRQDAYSVYDTAERVLGAAVGVHELETVQAAALKKACFENMPQAREPVPLKKARKALLGGDVPAPSSRPSSSVVPRVRNMQGQGLGSDCEEHASPALNRVLKMVGPHCEEVRDMQGPAVNRVLKMVGKPRATESPRKRQLKTTENDDSVVRSVKYVPLLQVPRVNQEKPKTFNSLFGTRCPAPRPQVSLDD